MLLLVLCNLNLLITSLISSIKQLFYAVYFLRFGEQKNWTSIILDLGAP